MCTDMYVCAQLGAAMAVSGCVPGCAPKGEPERRPFLGTPGSTAGGPGLLAQPESHRVSQQQSGCPGRWLGTSWACPVVPAPDAGCRPVGTSTRSQPVGTAPEALDRRPGFLPHLWAHSRQCSRMSPECYLSPGRAGGSP
ncbi:Hypothetical predicted protein [Marmota monax]|uniref:Uncharacterized protein n=1 Tax=Marmota monax TaxID=9995 RepID=A0A5E4CL89_MARMO|nr:hypothetical protein GHT09_008813 [Marmota monax]VTJ81692.1 Hypothetical predicted protein [Marmota monax]